MAKVYLRSYKRQEIIDLPAVCIKCGLPATIRKSTQFSWYPRWVNFLLLVGLWPALIVSLVLTKKQRVETPLCAQHKNYWWLPKVLWLLSFFGVLALGGIFLLVAAVAFPRGADSDGFGFVCFAWVVVFLVWLIALVVMNTKRIRPSEITDRRIALINVSQEFADAVEEQDEQDRRAFDRDDDERRPRRLREDDDRFSAGNDDPRYRK